MGKESRLSKACKNFFLAVMLSTILAFVFASLYSFYLVYRHLH